MDRIRIIIASAIFLLLTMAKIFFPQVGGQVREEVRDVINYSTDFTKAVSYISGFFQGDATQVYEEEPEIKSIPVSVYEYTPVTIDQLRAEVSSPVKVTIDDIEESQSEEEQQADETPAAVSAFLASQEAYSDYGVPEGVDYDIFELPFEYSIPVAGYGSSGFGYRLHPIQEEVKFHYGTDFAANSGDDIVAFASGTVTFAGYSESFGNYITIDHGDGWQTLYAHCSTLLVSGGETVSKGQRIALVGDTGLSTGPHLHFELTKDGVYVNPEYYINY